MRRLEDSELIAIVLDATCAGEAERAWDELLARHAGAVEGSIRRSFRKLPPSLIDEALAEANLKVLLSLANVRNRGSFRGFFGRIAKNCVLDVLRFQRRWVGLGDDEGEAGEPRAPAWSSEARSAEEERALFRLDVARALSKLPPRQREVLCLFHRDGYKYREIAALLGIAVGAVSSTLVAARRNLAFLLPF